jgi:hypothetical protein
MFFAKYTDQYGETFLADGDSIEEVISTLEDKAQERNMEFDCIIFYEAEPVNVTRQIEYIIE